MHREYFQIFPWSRMSHHLGHFSSDLKSSHCLELQRNSTEKASPYPQSPTSNCRPQSRPVKKAELWLLFHKEAKSQPTKLFHPIALNTQAAFSESQKVVLLSMRECLDTQREYPTGKRGLWLSRKWVNSTTIPRNPPQFHKQYWQETKQQENH